MGNGDIIAIVIISVMYYCVVLGMFYEGTIFEKKRTFIIVMIPVVGCVYLIYGTVYVLSKELFKEANFQFRKIKRIYDRLEK